MNRVANGCVIYFMQIKWLATRHHYQTRHDITGTTCWGNVIERKVVTDTAGCWQKDIKLKPSILLYAQGMKYAKVSNSNLVKFFTISSSTIDRNTVLNNDSSNPIQTATHLLSPTRQSQPTSNWLANNHQSINVPKIFLVNSY